MKEDYNKRPTGGQLIVIAFAVYGFMRLLIDLTGCSNIKPDKTSIYAGFGKQINKSEQWEREQDTYGTFGVSPQWLIHKDHNVWVELPITHDSMFIPETGCSGRMLAMDCGQNVIEFKFRKDIE
jgi:hypothetical protein